MIVEELIRMHHTYNESLSKEFEYEPPIERRAACNFVGLKNAGATCYMNSVLQQLYNVPNISDQVCLGLGNLYHSCIEILDNFYFITSWSCLLSFDIKCVFFSS